MLDPFFGSGTTGAVAKQLGRISSASSATRPMPRRRASASPRSKPLPAEALKVSTSKRAEPRIPFGSLIERGLVKAGDTLYDPAQRIAATVRADGSIACRDASGSIHKIGAHVQGAEACNGWTFWHVRKGKSAHPDRPAAPANARGDGGRHVMSAALRARRAAAMTRRASPKSTIREWTIASPLSRPSRALASQIGLWFTNGYPVFVAGEGSDIMAYAAAFPYRSRPCYDGVREFSIYVAREGRGLGFGRAALEALIDAMRRGAAGGNCCRASSRKTPRALPSSNRWAFAKSASTRSTPSSMAYGATS